LCLVYLFLGRDVAVGVTRSKVFFGGFGGNSLDVDGLETGRE